MSETGDVDIGEENGLILKKIRIPEEVLVYILSYVDLKSVLKCACVCKKWNEIIKSPHMWQIKCKRINKKSKKKLPWYAYYALFCDDFFDKNLILNNCGQERFEHWEINANGGNEFTVENPPEGANPVPETSDVEGENGPRKSCFATSYQDCSKFQIINFKKNLHRKIFDELKPEIYVSEWYAGRFDCGCDYKLSIWLMGHNNKILVQKVVKKHIEQWEGREWHKVEIKVDQYPKGLSGISFFHKGVDTQFWAGHYGSKMTGSVVKILWDSIAY